MSCVREWPARHAAVRARLSCAIARGAIFDGCLGSSQFLHASLASSSRSQALS